MIETLLTLMLAAVLVAFFRLRRRHRDARHTLNRLRAERDSALWKLAQQGDLFAAPTGGQANG